MFLTLRRWPPCNLLREFKQIFLVSKAVRTQVQWRIDGISSTCSSTATMLVILFVDREVLIPSDELLLAARVFKTAYHEGRD